MNFWNCSRSNRESSCDCCDCSRAKRDSSCDARINSSLVFNRSLSSMFSADILDIAVLICSYSDGEMPSNDLDEEGLYFPASDPKPYMRPFLSTHPTTSKKMKLSGWWSLDTSSPSVCCESLSKICLSYSSYKIRVRLNSYVQKYEIKLITTIKFIYKPTNNNLNKLKLAFN